MSTANPGRRVKRRKTEGLGLALGRGARRRCPECGRAPLFRGWLAVRSPCPQCGLVVLENEGDAWAFVILLDRVFVLLLLGLVFLRLGPPDTWALGAVFAALTGVFVYTTPHRFGVCLGMVYWLRVRGGALEDTESGSG